ncbi:hypothetical protein [Haloarcula salinisoli]|uniref:Uncharacterized protein n=1 Tax=Haloarcula salinisoli TaxID=2487746 RepID=A0A8J8C9J5_9EURY|nr:hypothetical protein [Halomicroarcula salinisoli]MBX0305681.1 hypothetical protein [Halomicroarcula salinisoli]
MTLLNCAGTVPSLPPSVSAALEGLTGFLGVPVFGVDIAVVGRCWYEVLVEALWF